MLCLVQLGVPRVHSFRMLRSRVRVQDEEDDDTRDGNVKPDGQSPPGYPAVKPELSPEGIPERAEDQWQRHHRQADVGDQDEKVNGPDPTLPRELGVAMEVVI